MGLAEQQAALAKLYTDSTSRKAFYKDAQEAGKSWGLSDADIREIVLVPREQIEGFARSLVAKRRSEVVKLLPMTHRFLGPDFIPLFRLHADTYLPAGSQRHRADALAFAGSLASGSLSAKCAEHIRDVARFERSLLIARSMRCPQLRLFRHDVRLADKSETNNEEVARLDRAIVCILIWPSRLGRIGIAGVRLT